MSDVTDDLKLYDDYTLYVYDANIQRLLQSQI